MKKLTIIFMAIIIFFLPLATTHNQIAHANVVSKPISFAAKKAAKELANEVAVEMVGNLALKYAVNTFENHEVKQGFKPICLAGGKTDINDCPADKKAQIKENLTSTDKTNLKSKVENVIELKTNTSSKWAKFLDWFVPVFLVSGAVALISSAMDSDSESLIDEIAQQALIDAGLMQSLKSTSVSTTPLYDWSQHVLKIEKTNDWVVSNPKTYALKFTMKDLNHKINIKNGEKNVATITNGRIISLSASAQSRGEQGGLWSFRGTIGSFHNGINFPGSNDYPVIETDYKYVTAMEASEAASDYTLQYMQNLIYSNDLNTHANNFIAVMQLVMDNPITVDLETLTPPEVHTDYGIQTAIDLVKDQTGAVSVPGIEAFTFTDPATQSKVYPSPDGWRNKDTGELVQVNEDTIIAEDKLGEEDTPPKEEFPNCTKDFKKIEFKKVGTAFTYAFPFSIPWDIKRFFDAAFSGVGDERPSFSLPDYFGDVKFEIPRYFDTWVSFFRTFIIIMFDISLIYLFYRFMRGGGD